MDLIISIVCIILGIAVYATSGNYDIFTYDPVGGGGFPRLLAAIIIVCGIMIGIQYFMKRQKKKPQATEEKVPQKMLKGSPKEPLLMLVALIIYALVMEHIGYVVCTLLLVSGLMFIQHERGFKRLVLVPIFIVAALYLIFNVVLGVKMPTGFLI